MSAIDVRDGNYEVNEIVFANETSGDEREIGHKLIANDFHSEHIFLEGSEETYQAVRRSDVPHLIKALQVAQDLWEGCK